MSVDSRAPVRELPEPRSLGRRRFLGYLVAAPTLAVAVKVGWDAMAPGTASAAIPSNPLLADGYDLGDLQNNAAAPTSHLVTVQVNADGTVSFALPRAEVGQGITTAFTMIIAEEMDLPMHQVTVTLADARPELVMNQLTGGSNSIRSLFIPVRTAAAIAKQRLVLTAAKEWKLPAKDLTTKDGMISHRSGKLASYASLAQDSAVSRLTETSVVLKQPSEFKIIGTPRGRVDAHAIVTGKKVFAMDMDVPGALPTMLARPPTINGRPKTVLNADEVTCMPGVTDIAVLRYGVAVRAETFGQCIDGLRALKVDWGPGTVDGESDESVLRKLRAEEVPLAVPSLKKVGLAAIMDTVGADTMEDEFVFAFASSSALEPDCAVADVRKDRAEIWACLKIPITAKEDIAKQLGMPKERVAVHVVHGGGSFGRHLFHDHAAEAAEASQKMGKPVKLMWTRADAVRQGRTHPMSISRVRATYAAKNVVSYEQRHTSVRTDYSHGFGEMFSMAAARSPLVGNYTVAQGIFHLSQSSPYNFGPTTMALNEIPLKFNTGSMRNIFSPNVVTAQELMVDRLADKMGKDPVEFRREFLRHERLKRVMEKAVEVGDWGRSLPDGVAQGIGLHFEYQGAVAALVEIDCRPETVNRKVRNGVTGPRVTKALVVVDPGMVINPRGLEAQMMGGMSDAIALILTSSVHIKDGIPLEASWDNYFYTREWNVPKQMRVVIHPINNDVPSGGGELGVAPCAAAVACAYARATGTNPTYFPINHHTLSFKPYPLQPSTPEPPDNGLEHY